MRFQSNIVRFHFGLSKPVRILHITDIHLSLADDTDGEDMKRHARERRKTFVEEAGYPERDPVGYLQEAMEYAKEFDCTVITGDMLDFTSHANCKTAKEILAGKDYLFCAGNHEFCPKVGIPDSFARKREKFDEIQSLFRGSMTFESRIVGGVNVISIDNGYYLWTEEQFRVLQAEVAKGMPCLLFCHCPLTEKYLWHEPNHPDLTAGEDEIELTRKVTNYIINEPAIKAVFSGHYHKNGTEVLGEKTGYILGGLFKGIVGEIEID